MLEEMLDTIDYPFKKDIEQFKINISKLRNKLESSYRIIDSSLLKELESRIGSLEKKINSPLNKAVVTEIRLELSLLDKKIGELNAYFTMINKVKYISESLGTISKENLLECVGMMTELIDELNRNELFHLNSQSKKVEMTYKVAYNLIKKEILINHSSLLLSAIKDDEISSSYICRLIFSEIKEIFDMTCANPKAIKNLETVLSKITSNEIARVLDNEVIKSILLVTDYEELKDSFLKEFMGERGQLEVELLKEKSTIDDDISTAIEEKKNKILELKKKTKSIISPTILLLMVISAIASGVVSLNNIDKNKTKYNTETLIYVDTSDEIIRTTDVETKLTDALHTEYNLNGELFEFETKRTLEICGETYFDENWHPLYTYTLYDVNDYLFEDYSNYEKIDESDLQDKIIESGIKKGEPLFHSKVEIKTQDTRNKILDEDTIKSRKFSIALLGFNVILNFPVQTYYLFSNLKKRFKLKSLIKKNTPKIESLINRCNDNKLRISYLKELSNQLKALSQVESFTSEEVALLDVSEIESENNRLIKKLHEDIVID